MSRRRTAITFISLSLALAVALPGIGGAQEDRVDVYGRTLPEDAAPYSMQIWQDLCDSTRSEIALSSVVSVYQRICSLSAFDQFSDPLVEVDQDFNYFPASAESWEPAEDGLSWIFHIKPDLVWSDGTPVTANDWVASWRYMVDPGSAYDFVWMWQGIIKGWSEANAGEIPPEEIGVVAVDDLTLQIFTEGPTPFLPQTFNFWPPLQAKALEEHGPNYLLDPATAVSSGPFILREFVPGDYLVLEANPTYKGYRTPWLREIRGVYGDLVNGSFLAFQNHEIDRVNYENLKPSDFEIIMADPTLRENLRMHQGDFRTDYLVFDTFNPPFNDVRVRMAFAKAVDRESIADNVINTSGVQSVIPATTMLAPGYPAWDAEGEFRDIQAYDCPAAQELLADAGYPNGEGFPPQEMKLRGKSEGLVAWYTAVAASISECLNIPISVNNMEFSAYMEALLARPTTLQFGGIDYGMDYLDPSNMLGLWHSRGRHSWRNAEFDAMIDEANVLVGDPETRFQMYHDAERILVEDVGGAFLFHRNLGELFQPYIAGPNCFAPDKVGISAWHWNNQWCWGDIYVTQDVDNYETYRTR